VIAAFRAKDYKKVFELSEQWLAKCLVDADIHMLRSGAATELGDIRSYVHHYYYAFGLMQSVMQSGDGLTPQPAFKVISVAEEYSVLREFRAQVTRQTLIEDVIDKMECKYPNDQTVILYFNASIPIKALEAELK
jgi:hypothetical protein